MRHTFISAVHGAFYIDLKRIHHRVAGWRRVGCKLNLFTPSYVYLKTDNSHRSQTKDFEKSVRKLSGKTLNSYSGSKT